MFERDKRRTNHVVSLRFLFKKKFTEAAGMFQEHVCIYYADLSQIVQSKTCTFPMQLKRPK